MKKLFLMLVVASMFIASTAMAATWNGTLDGTLLDNPSNMSQPICDTSGWTVTVPDGTTIADAAADVTLMYFNEGYIDQHGEPALSPSNYDQAIPGAFQGVQFDDANGDGTPGDFVAPPGIPGTLFMGNDSFPLSIYGISSTTTTDGFYTWGIGETGAAPLESLGIQADGSLNLLIYVSLREDMVVGPMTLPAYSLSATFLMNVVDPSAPPIPIPGAVWLLLSGLVGIIGLRRKS